jgi:hypothetical protein
MQGKTGAAKDVQADMEKAIQAAVEHTRAVTEAAAAQH